MIVQCKNNSYARELVRGNNYTVVLTKVMGGDTYYKVFEDGMFYHQSRFIAADYKELKNKGKFSIIE